MIQDIYEWCFNCEHGSDTDPLTLKMCRGCLRTIIYENLGSIPQPDHYKEVQK